MTDPNTHPDTRNLDRRTFLATLASAGVGSLAGCSFTEREPDGATTETDPETAESLARRFAPTLYFDAAEPWYPTDPRPYESERDGDAVVDGFDALDGYHERVADAEGPPNPTVFYNAVEYDDSPLAVVQFWLYSAFDQFTTNFHWHDWEVLHVFVDTETDRPQLYVSSSHSRRVPNNEFLDPDPEMVPRILSELGSHSSALSVNDEPDQFQRLPGADLLADITNSAIESVEALSEIPLAYGLPRDEGARLPYVVPEYEGVPVYDHDRLPNVDRTSLVDEELTVRSFEALSSPPTDLPARSTGVVFRHEGRGDSAADGTTEYAYELVPTAELEHITAFTGPQLSFEFSVPEFAEDAIAGHITTTGVPWEQPRYENPAADITDPNHRSSLSERYDAIGDAAPINTVVAGVTEAVSNDDAPDGEGLTTQTPTVEAVALLESDPTAVPTFGGVVALRDVSEGDHRLTVNAAGRAPYSEQLSVGGEASSTTTAPSTTPSDTGASTETETTVATGTETTASTGTETTAPTETETTAATAETETEAGTSADATDPDRDAQRVTAAGSEGEIPLVARENARKLEIDADGTDAHLTNLAIEDDFAGRLYDSPLDGSDAVYVHRGGAYTTEVRDADGAVGAFRVNPDPASGADGDDASERGPPIRIERPETGKASLSSFLASITAETSEELSGLLDDGGSGGSGDTLVGRENALRGLVRALDAVASAAERAAESARGGDRSNADRRLRTVTTGLERIVELIDEASDDLPDPLERAVEIRVDEATRRAEQAQDAEKL
ncbi:hypothetical protein [Halobellus limi]|uniref:Uncharacterized protein n=1 Tax=Halobellus limi TaxID=699433 RepID=A0A1H5VG67_9EURY|nr:hypothetical protein [Halobellus limi]QCC46720.1 hypothetical protein DV707_03015 [Halobellus limi]SEF86214.1 hypothetical protein SAMN04488133_0953 [Halobellus limi]